MPVQTINATASKVSKSSTLIRLSTNNASLTMISVRPVTAGQVPQGTYFADDVRADLFIAQSDFGKLGTALDSSSTIPVTLKYDDSIDIDVSTNATEFDFGSPQTVCQLTIVPIARAAATGTFSNQGAVAFSAADN